eukprot:11154064-Ditylum_brightwellii.AAC.1
MENVVCYCLPENDCYNFTIADNDGDGICCYSEDGIYSVGWEGSEVSTGGTFGYHELVMFGGDCSALLNMRRTLSNKQLMRKGSCLVGNRKILFYLGTNSRARMDLKRL